jgi:hypothetical protein
MSPSCFLLCGSCVSWFINPVFQVQFSLASTPLGGKTKAQTRPIKSRHKCPLSSVSKTKKTSQSHNTLVIKWLQDHVLPKKSVVKPSCFSYFHCQLHRMVPGQTGFALRRVRRETRKH